MVIDSEKEAALLKELGSAQESYNQQLLNFGDVTTKVHSFVNGFNGAMEKAGVTIDSVGKFAANHSLSFAALGAKIVNVTDHLKGMNAIDPGSINSFSAPIKELSAALLQGGTVGQFAADRIMVLKDKLLSMGVSQEKITQASRGGSLGILGLAETMIAAADKAHNLETSMLQTAAATGELGMMYAVAGPNLENMNALLHVQNEMMNRSKASTHSSDEQMVEYFNGIKRIPGALSEIVKMNKDGTESTSMLTAAIKLAHGTHMSYSDIMQDVATSFTEYGVKGESALRFTNRFSEISQKYKIELKDVRNGLLGAADAFKNMTNAGDASSRMQEGVSEVMNQYVQRLKDAGMTGKHAVETITGMLGSFKEMSIAQKAFLSAQTGGPGGLMGGFQIEKMIQEGNIPELQKKMSQMMTKMFGPRIVTLEEAAKSQDAAAQLQKQVAMVRQGPMGQMFKSDQDAYKFFAAEKSRREGKETSTGVIEELRDNALQESIEKGSKWEKETYTVMHGMAEDISALRSSVVESAGRGAKELFTARNQNMRPMLADRENEAKTRETKQAEYRAEKLGGRQAISERENLQNIQRDTTDSAKSLLEKTGPAFVAGVGVIGNEVTKALNFKQKNEMADLEKEREMKRQNQTRTGPGYQKSGTEEMNTQPVVPPGQQLQKAATQQAKAPAAPAAYGNVARPGENVGNAPRPTATARGTAGTAATTPQAPAEPSALVRTESADGIKVYVKVERENPHVAASTPGATQ